MNEVNSFTFYRDYYNLIDTMPIEDKEVLAIAILDYVFKDVEPELTGHNQAIFTTLSHQLDVSKNKSKSAKKENQKEIKKKSNENQMKINKDNKTSILSFKFLISNFKFSNNNINLKNKLEEWLKYKWERKEYYKETGFNTLLARIDRATSQYGVETVINLIDECMANNYKGIIFEKLQKSSQKKVITTEWLNNDIESLEASDEDIRKLEERMRRVKNEN